MKLDADERQKIYDEKWLPFIKNFQRSMGEEEYTSELTNAFYPTFRTSICSIHTSIISSIAYSILIRICSSKNIYSSSHWPTK